MQFHTGPARKLSTNLYDIYQRFSNFFQVGTTLISQNVLRTTLLLGLSISLGLTLNSVRNMFLQQKIPLFC